MSRKYKQACLVELAPVSTWRKLCDSATWKSKEPILNGSGIFISRSHGWVITHGSLLLTYFCQDSRESDLHDRDFFEEKYFANLVALVTLEPKEQLTEVRDVSKQGTLFQPTHSVQEVQPEQYPGKIKCMWKAKGFSRAVETLLPESEGWSFYEDPDSKNSEHLEEKLVGELLPYFILIDLIDQPKQKDLIHPFDGSVSIGSTVHMVGTPFGSMSPSVFMNSVSQGVIANVAGQNQELIITDARCIPGTEGGPLYLGDAKHSNSLVGVVVSSLCWKNHEWIGLSLVCHIREVLHSLEACQHRGIVDIPKLTRNRTKEFKKLPDTSEVFQLIDLPVVLVKCQGSWGSGLIVDQEQGIVLTCGHVVNQQNHVHVRVDGNKPHWYGGDVIFATPLGHVFDLAIVHLHGYLPNKKWPNQVQIAESVQEGERCFVVGHAIFGQQHNLPASITSGIICKMIRLQGLQVLLQSTCAVNPGASGGPLISNDGRIIGIVTCNAKDTMSGASYPNINLAVPMDTIWPVIEDYLNTHEASVLRALHIKNKKVENLWKMHGSHRNLKVMKSRL